jgi:hypothetical protein
MGEAGEDPKVIARRMVIFASELKVPSGRGHAAPASLVNLKKLEDRVYTQFIPSHPACRQSRTPLPYFLPPFFRTGEGIERAIMGNHVHRLSCHNRAASDLALRLELPQHLASVGIQAEDDP